MNDASDNWNKVYEAGDKYVDAPPISFVNEIFDTLNHRGAHRQGLYIGCGNGRNFIPLAEAGLNLTGLDISQAALDQLAHKLPGAKLVCQDFATYSSDHKFDYVIAIQVFQHGNLAHTKQLLTKIADLLVTDGLFFLRVKSINMPVKHPHKIIEKTAGGAFTVHFESGPKRGLDIHYFSSTELTKLAAPEFNIISEPKEVQSDSKSHLETIWQRN